MTLPSTRTALARAATTVAGVGLPLLLVACGSGSSGDDPINDANDVPIDDPVVDGGGIASDEPGAEPGTSSTVPVATRQSAIGDVFASSDESLTLYLFSEDADGVSNCNDGCADVWPPLSAAEAGGEGDFSTLVRDDQSLQWAYRGRPLYRYVGDANAGETNGEGIGGSWFVARPTPVTRTETELGAGLSVSGSTSAGQGSASVRNDFDGRTLYVFDRDEPDRSNCNDDCAGNWPPLYADDSPAVNEAFSVITRDDGTRQWAFRSRPLYLYAGDAAAGDVNGEGVGGVWFVARP